MFRNRSTRVIASLGISLTLALTALAGPAVILAARASAEQWAIAVPPSVTPGADVAFDVHFKNTSTSSNISQLYLNAETPADWWLVGVEFTSQPSCDTSSGDLHCSFGAVNAGASVDLRVVYTTDEDDSGKVTVPFGFTTTGATPGGADSGKHSHGDDFPAPGEVSFSTSQDFAGYYITDGTGLVTVSDSTALHSRRNPQYTQVFAPEDAIGVTVGEGGTFTCPAETGGTCFGQWSVIYVNDGYDYGDDSVMFKVVLGYTGNIGNANFVHVLDDGTVELIDDECSSDPPPVSEADPGCFIIDSVNGASIVTLWLTQNGRLSGY